ncbi:MAG: cell wall hydrolase [Eubacteriales bacterium]|nr:cell wall hydrolase [Eubacteriales bacterium]
MEVFQTLLEVMYKKAVRFIRQTRRRFSKQKHSAVIVTASMLAVALLCALGVSGESRSLIRKGSTGYVAVGVGIGEVQAADTSQTEELQAGLMGVVAGAVTMEEYSQAAKEIDLAGANEHILIGASRASRSEVIREALTEGTKSAGSVVTCAKKLVRENQMAESEYYTLLQIVEAEATGEDLKGKMLIANVILNRVKDERFPNTIEEVVWQQVGGSAQFQPTIDGRIYTVEVTDDTIRAVDRVLGGEDYSQGALYFMARMASEDNSIGWFDTTLIPLFEHGGHEYYTISKEATVS